MTKYELISKEALDKALEILLEVQKSIMKERDMDYKFTILSDIDKIYTGLNKERCECNVMPYQEF